jgi:hypothetical protein
MNDETPQQAAFVLATHSPPPRHCHEQQQPLQSEYLQRTAPPVWKTVMDSRKFCLKETDLCHAEYFKHIFYIIFSLFLLSVSSDGIVVCRTSRETFLITLHYLLTTSQKFGVPHCKLSHGFNISMSDTETNNRPYRRNFNMLDITKHGYRMR